MIYDEFITSESAKFLNQALELKVSEKAQEWALEAADRERVADFIDYFQNAKLGQNKRLALMELIVSSYSDYLESYEDKEGLWLRMSEVFSTDKELLSAIQARWPLELRNEFPVIELLHHCPSV
ncbi:MAG: hypothetical protein JJ850_05300 [Kordiimonadaceae bacterium]|nr:hypothetical protein [Kordiimonadaceae bacterium]MBO6568262.1 hypothetical protein [Kordiimonadaceae bacterium]MBO6964008.1 hypothetical protein [Kordiimonadaceae bacterium]